ncbi:MAG: hypothetical protein ACOC0A_02440 [Planctomycetota bacterium]
MIDKKEIGFCLLFILSTVVLVGSVPQQAEAHTMKIFASREDDAIRGFAYFPGGERAGGVEVSLEKKDGTEVESAKADDDGNFEFAKTQGSVRYRVVAESSDGHRATFEVDGQEPSEDEDGQQTEVDSSDEKFGAEKTGGIRAKRLETIMGKVIERRIRPLREDIAEAQSRTRFRDVLGGIGYILGLCGIAFYFMARKQKKEQHSENE